MKSPVSSIGDLNFFRHTLQVFRLSRQKFEVPIRALLLTAYLGPFSARADSGLIVNTNRDRNIVVNYISYPESTNSLGYWIWDRFVTDKQIVRLRTSFIIPSKTYVTNAELRLTADNAFKFWIDGQEIGNGSDWRTLSIYEMSGRLNPGVHVLAVEGFNDADKAGVIAGLRLDLADGQKLQLRSDTNSWHVAPDSDPNWKTSSQADDNWPAASFVAQIGQAPWWYIPTTVIHVETTLPNPIEFWQTRTFQFLLCGGCVACMAICFFLMMRLWGQSKAHALIENERDRIARDIHDDLGSKITQLLLTGEMTQLENKTEAEQSALIRQICENTRDIMATLGEVVWIVNSTHDTLDDFTLYVCKYTQSFLKISSIRCRLNVPHELSDQKLPQSIRRNLFLVIKEALTNAVKHSRATELNLEMKLVGDLLSVFVQDNGIGFVPTQNHSQIHGLANMAMRLKEIGGTFQITSHPGEGCQIQYKILLKRVPFYKRLFKP